MSASGGMDRLLRPIPVRYRVSAIAAELEGLRAWFGRVKAALSAHPPLADCTVCGSGGLRVAARKRLPQMGELGPQELTIQCDNAGCRHRETHLHAYRPAEV